jgi:hypothetical protein
MQHSIHAASVSGGPLLEMHVGELRLQVTNSTITKDEDRCELLRF